MSRNKREGKYAGYWGKHWRGMRNGSDFYDACPSAWVVCATKEIHD